MEWKSELFSIRTERELRIKSFLRIRRSGSTKREIEIKSISLEEKSRIVKKYREGKIKIPIIEEG